MTNETKNPGQGHDEVTIVVNAEEKAWHSKEISFEQVVNLAYDGKPPQGPNWTFTVGFRRGDEHSREGTLLPGKSVTVKNGMVFNVTATDKS